MTRTVIDSHLHVWDLQVSAYAWLRPEHGPLYDTFTPEEAAHELATAGVTAAILVQAEDSLVDTDYLLEVADRFDFVAGVVGWVALDDPTSAAWQLERYAERPLFRGARHLVHDDPRDDFLRLPGVRTSLGMLSAHGLAFDVPDAWPRHLTSVAELAEEMPTLTVVVDHLAKPPRGSDDLAEWERQLRRVAASPNAVAKLSGLQMPGQPFTRVALRPLLDIALDAFGADRLMYGGDWPMTVPQGGYGEHWEVVSELIGELSESEQDRLLSGTATAVYGLTR
jgi:L-fuconolactonase